MRLRRQVEPGEATRGINSQGLAFVAWWQLVGPKVDPMWILALMVGSEIRRLKY